MIQKKVKDTLKQTKVIWVVPINYECYGFLLIVPIGHLEPGLPCVINKCNCTTDLIKKNIRMKAACDYQPGVGIH